MTENALTLHEQATEHLPWFVTGPGQSDSLLTAMAVFLVFLVFAFGTLYLRLHSLPEHMAHRTSKVQLQFVAVLGLLALFTHNHAFWIAALLLALIELPDFGTPITSIARSLEKLSGRPHPEPAPDMTDDVAALPVLAAAVEPAKE